MTRTERLDAQKPHSLCRDGTELPTRRQIVHCASEHGPVRPGKRGLGRQEEEGEDAGWKADPGNQVYAAKATPNRVKPSSRWFLTTPQKPDPLCALCSPPHLFFF